MYNVSRIWMLLIYSENELFLISLHFGSCTLNCMNTLRIFFIISHKLATIGLLLPVTLPKN